MDIANGRYWDKAWSLVEGCTPVSEACDHCWLRSMHNRFKQSEFDRVISREDRLDIPLRTRKPTVFAIWSDLFHEAAPFDFILRALSRMVKTSQHTYLILTKRPDRMLEFCTHWGLIPDPITGLTGSGERIPDNVWLGTTVENQEQADKRIPELLKAPGKKFLSIEPLLGPVNILRFCNQVDAVIVGGESGHGARPMHPDWVLSLRDQCDAAGVPFFFKQWGEWSESQPYPNSGMKPYQSQTIGDTLMFRCGKKRAGRFLDGREHNELPWIK
jgi:protein gp37